MVREVSDKPLQNKAARVIDLKGKTLMPGLIEGHAHFLLHPYDETSWNDQVAREPLATDADLLRGLGQSQAAIDRFWDVFIRPALNLASEEVSAASAMKPRRTYAFDPAARRVYDGLYAIYRSLHDGFGGAVNFASPSLAGAHPQFAAS